MNGRRLGEKAVAVPETLPQDEKALYCALMLDSMISVMIYPARHAGQFF
jgi:hypothetical protein